MKKLFYIFLFAVSSSLTFSACTEEEVIPAVELKNGGANGSMEPIKR